MIKRVDNGLQMRKKYFFIANLILLSYKWSLEHKHDFMTILLGISGKL